MAYYVENEFDGNGRPIDDYDPYLWVIPRDQEPDDNCREITLEDAVGWTEEHGYGECELCADRQLTEARIEEAVAEFRKNPHWRGIYDDAPRGAKEYLALEFTKSHFCELCEANGEECADRTEELRETLKSADWEYLIEHAGTNGAAGMAKAQCRKFLARAREREALKRDRQSGTRLIRELRHAYREWDAGRMTDDEYNAEAHRIEGIGARLKAAGMIGMNLIDKLHNLHVANAYAVDN